MGRTLKDIKEDIRESSNESANVRVNASVNYTGLTAPNAKRLRRHVRDAKRNPIDTFSMITPDNTRRVKWF